MKKYFDARVVDCGPVIRSLFAESKFDSFKGWARYMEQEFGRKWDDKLLLVAIKNSISSERLLFIVGNRDIETILFLSENLPHKKPSIILYLEKPVAVMKSGYELRTKTALTDEEFNSILHSGPDRKIESIRQYVIGHPEYCNLIYEDSYGDVSISKAMTFVSDRYK
ncbi:hypothetical protein MBO12_04180 [Candidatus Saccharibacteria bacterium]|nr:hypothetical protein [Candidatus Saccharibacteria bacterium]